jgi:23S rRNA pseudouridine1911/1915/1917 synthase
MSSKKIEFIVPENLDNVSVNTFLRKECCVSARIIAQLKREKDGILRDNKNIKTIDKLNAGDKVILNLPDEENNITAVKGDLNILYEDDYIIAFDKPFGVPVHPTKVHQTDTLANFHSYRQKQLGENYKFRALNRLDKDTSGIVIAAKDKYTASYLFNRIDKTYFAVCEGVIKNPGTIDKPIKIKEGHTIQRTCSDDGQKSVTHFIPICSNKNHTLLKIKLETGRTHQIRTHFSFLGHSLAGDDMYGGSLNYIKRQALHCGEVSFTHLFTNEKIVIKSDIPADMMNIIK